MARLTLGAVMLLALVAPAAPAEAAHRARSLPPPPSELPQTWIASFHLSKHTFGVGEKMKGTVKVLAEECFGSDCVTGIQWPYVAGKIVKGCKQPPRGTPTLRCVWKLSTPTEDWNTAAAYFNNPTGTTATSQDYYFVSGRPLIDGYVKANGAGQRGVRILINGKRKYYAKTDSSGYYSALVKPGAYRVRAKAPGSKPRSERVRVKGPHVAHVNFKVIKPRFNAYGVDGNNLAKEPRIGATGRPFTYDGRHWDPDGAKVVVRWDDRVLGRYPAGKRFSATKPVPTFGDGRCRSTLKASQGRLSKRIKVKGNRAALVVATHKVARIKKGRRLRKGDFICEGEEHRTNVGDGGVLVAQQVGFASFSGLMISSDPAGVELPGGVWAPKLYVGTGRDRGIPISFSGPDPAQYDPAGRPGVAEISPGRHTSALTVAGFNRSSGSIEISRGGLHLDGAVLYVDGNLEVRGGITGTGLLAVGGRVYSHGGPVTLVSDNVNSIVAGTKIILATKAD